MQFNLPTTKEQMYTTLNDLFYYYRIRRDSFEEIGLQPLDLTRLEYTPETDLEIMNRARSLVTAGQKREIEEYKMKLNSRIEEIDAQLTLIEQNALLEIETVKALYSESVEKVEKQAIKAGLINSNIVIDKTAKLEDSKNSKIAKITQTKNQKIAELTAEKEAILAQLAQSGTYMQQVHEYEISKKVAELCVERDTLNREVFIYNNGLDEKEQRYKNTIKQTQASLLIRYLDVSAGEFTKDQLVDMGYYEDVIRCVCGYYDTLQPSVAYRDILDEGKLAIYLDDYYESIIYLYKSAAGM